MLDGSMDSYAAQGGKFSPDVMIQEQGAVLCRVSRSFLRFSQLELFAKRDEMLEMEQLAEFVCFREVE